MHDKSHWNRRQVLTTASSITAVGVAGCLGTLTDSDRETRDTESQNTPKSNVEINGPVQNADVAMISGEGHYFAPNIVWVESGGTVTWTNESGSHTATAYHPEFDKPHRIPDGAEAWNSGMFSEPGATFDNTFDVDGVYDYFCVPHEHRAMVGTVIVGDPALHQQPGLTTPQDDLPAEARELLSELNDRVSEVLERNQNNQSQMNETILQNNDTRLFNDVKSARDNE